jgi:hypothetical protein
VNVLRPAFLSDRLVTATACVLGLLLTARAVLTIDPYFDTFAYHLPFAARAVGLCPETCWRMGSLLETRYLSFPPLFDVLQGLLWLLLGSPQALDLLNIAAMSAFAGYLRRAFGVPMAWTLVGLLAIPIVQIHVTATYIDLPLNLAIGAAALTIFDLQRSESHPGWRRPALVVLCLAFAANSKLTMIPVAAAIGSWLFVVLTMRLGRGLARQRNAAVLGLVTVVGAAVVFASALHNLVVFGNPIYPVAVDIAGLRLPGPEAVIIPHEDSLPGVWLDVPSPLRWLASVLEVGGYADRPLPWTYDQGNWITTWPMEPYRPGVAPSFRMGGYFVAYVLFLVVFLIASLRRQATSDRRAGWTAFLVVTLLAAFLPHSHELRYDMFWIIVVAALVLILTVGRLSGGKGDDSRRRTLAAGLLVALGCVVLLTGGWYLRPTGLDLADLLDELRIEHRLAGVRDGEIVCIDPGWQPLSFLFAPVFQNQHKFTAVGGTDGSCTRVIGPPHRLDDGGRVPESGLPNAPDGLPLNPAWPRTPAGHPIAAAPSWLTDGDPGCSPTRPRRCGPDEPATDEIPDGRPLAGSTEVS